MNQTLEQLMEQTRLKTGISKLNEALDGGFKLGEVWAIAGKYNTFRAGLAYSIARDIVMHNQLPDHETPTRLMLGRGEYSNDNVLKTMRLIMNGHVDKRTWRSNDEVFNGGIPNKQGWVVQTRTDLLIRTADELQYEIDFVESRCSEKIKVVVLDEIKKTAQVNGVFVNVFRDIRTLCMEKNMLAIVPTYNNNESVGIRTEYLDGVIYTKVNENRDALSLLVHNKRTGKSSKFDLPMKTYPEYGLVPDPETT